MDPIPRPPLSFAGARIQRQRITKQDIDEFGDQGQQMRTRPLTSLQSEYRRMPQSHRAGSRNIESAK